MDLQSHWKVLGQLLTLLSCRFRHQICHFQVDFPSLLFCLCLLVLSGACRLNGQPVHFLATSENEFRIFCCGHCIQVGSCWTSVQHCSQMLADNIIFLVLQSGWKASGGPWAVHRLHNVLDCLGPWSKRLFMVFFQSESPWSVTSSSLIFFYLQLLIHPIRIKNYHVYHKGNSSQVIRIITVQ